MATSNLNYIAPDAMVEQQALARQQALADMLRQQSLTASQGQVVGGQLMPTGHASGLLKLAQALSATSMQGDIDEKQTAANQRMAALLNKQAYGDQPDQGEQLSQPSQPGAAPAAQSLQQIYGRANAIKALAGEEAAKDFLTRNLPTEAVRTMQGLGQDPADMGRLGRAKAAKETILEMQPGTTSLNFATGAERFQPKVGEGIQLQNGQAAAVPGYAGANAEIQGAQTAAQESAKAGLDIVDVPMGDGTTMRMPRSEAVKALRSRNPSIPSVGTRDPTPTEMAAIQADAQASGIKEPFINLSGASKTGITLSDAEKAKQRILAEGIATRANEDITKGNQLTDFGNQITMARQILKAGPTGSGIGAYMDKAGDIVGMSTTSGNLAKQLETISGWMLQNIPKAPGAQSDAELRDYKVSAGQIGDPTIPAPKRLAALDVVETLKNKWEARQRGESDQGIGAVKPPPIGTVQDGFKFKGGNPGDKNNWERL